MDKFINVIDDYVLKYAYYREVIAGTKYLDLDIQELSEGIILTYEIDLSNEYDSNAIKLKYNDLLLGYVHKNYIQEMIQSYSKRKNFKIEIILNKINIEKGELGYQIAFYQKYSNRFFNILNRFKIECDAVENKYYKLRKDKRTNQYYIVENGYIFKSEKSKLINQYLENYASVLLKGVSNKEIEVIVVV